MNANTQKINTKSVLAYVLLPGIIPRLKELVGTGFGYFAFLIASVFQGVRILPPGHPAASFDNMGKYSVRQILSIAANHIEFSRRNIDQIAIFGAVLLSIVLLILQFVLFVFALMSNKAFAQETGGDPFTNIFVTDHPQTDIAFMMLDYVFGVPNMFGSNALQGEPTPFHQGLHDLFQFYNLAILLVGVLIFMYYVVVVVIETAQTGVPFGRRFSKIYAPFRLIAAVGLLVPLNYGFNAAQYITFYAAKLGSSFATNGWILYNEQIENPMGVDNASLIAGATPPDLNGLFYYTTVYHSCREIYKIYVPSTYNQSGNGGKTVEIKPYVIVNGNAEPLEDYSYQEAKQDFGTSDMEIVMGELNTSVHTAYTGGVRPYCGKMVVSLSAKNPPYLETNSESGTSGSSSRPYNPGSGYGGNNIVGVTAIEMTYFSLAKILLTDTTRKFAAVGERMAHANVPGRRSEASEDWDGGGARSGAYDTCWRSEELDDGPTCKTSFAPPNSSTQDDIDFYTDFVDNAAALSISNMRENINLKLSTDMEKYGWGGAGIWYNRVAEINGAVSSAIFAAPKPKAYPEVMDFVRKEKEKANTSSDQCNTFAPNLADHTAIKYANPHYDPTIARVGNAAYKWPCDRGSEEGGVPKGKSGNVFIDVVSVLFGVHGLFELRDQTKMNEETLMPEVHPLAALSAIGKALVENAIRSMATSLFFSFGGGMGEILAQGLGAGLQSISKMFVSVATIGLTAGFLLYYILPFLPFIYFFFAVGSWVKSIFEAMVGAPLWALAHLRIDGDGFSGRAAAAGYLLIFEIFLRPIVTVFGLIGGMAVFGASVAVMNDIFGMVVANIVGDDPSSETGATITNGEIDITTMGAIDQFFFTIMYTLLVYMMATACFKMIDTIPKQIMRWMGSQVSTFNDNTADPTQNLSQYAALGGSQAVQTILPAINQGGQAAGGLVAALTKGATSTGDKQPGP